MHEEYDLKIRFVVSGEHAHAMKKADSVWLNQFMTNNIVLH